LATVEEFRITEVGGKDFVMVMCPECDAQIDVDEGDVDEGDSLSCDECGADLKVVSITPLELEAEDDEEEEEDEDAVSDDDDDEEEEEEEDEEWK
jgi:alpha-aminoadipate carrier protein LysW